MKPLVSILIPAYNAERWLSDTLRSAITQTWSRKEIIVVDDGSKDQTQSIARQFESDSVRVYTQENSGAAAARNKAFSLSRGDYIQWLDADDLLAPDKIELQMNALSQCGPGRTLLSSAWKRFMYRHYRAKLTPSGLWCDLTPLEWLCRKLEQNVYMQTATWLVSREITEAAGPWDTRLLGDDDGEYFCRVLLASERVKFVREATVFYRMAGSGSLSYIGRSRRKQDAQWISMELHMKYIRSLEDSERVRAACVKYLQDWLTYFYPERPELVRAAEETARELGGKLVRPRLPQKYAPVRWVLGREAAKRAQIVLPRMKWSLKQSVDRALYHLQTQGRSKPPLFGDIRQAKTTRAL